MTDATGSRVQAAARAIHRLQHVYGNEGDDPCDMCLEEAEAALSAADAVDATPDHAASNRVPDVEQMADAIAEWDTTGLLTAEQAYDLAKFLAAQMNLRRPA